MTATTMLDPETKALRDLIRDGSTIDEAVAIMQAKRKLHNGHGHPDPAPVRLEPPRVERVPTRVDPVERVTIKSVVDMYITPEDWATAPVGYCWTIPLEPLMRAGTPKRGGRTRGQAQAAVGGILAHRGLVGQYETQLSKENRVHVIYVWKRV